MTAPTAALERPALHEMLEPALAAGSLRLIFTNVPAPRLAIAVLDPRLERRELVRACRVHGDLDRGVLILV
jgi:hypothetical protein